MTIPPAPRTGPTHPEVGHLVGATTAALQDRLAGALGVSRARRIETVVAMLENNSRRAPGYWIQLLLATGIATLGLVLGSTAVVIGGMLVSPLMGPIVELGMGFGVGSSLLVIRASIRVTLSVLAVVAGAAIVTVGLPFHEVTSEIASRTAPTALDLLVAAFVALTAAYTVVRAGADTAAAAAGTAIGIALVPPLCVAGFGIGTGSRSVATGASLLFTANFSAILVLAVLSFLLLGFNQVPADTLEHDYLSHDATRIERLAERGQIALGAAFGSRYGLAVRVLIPLIFLLAVYTPLSRALDEVSWEVRVRGAIRRVLDQEAARAVQTTLAVERHAVVLRLLVVGTPDDAASLERRLRASITSVANVPPTISVVAVPDAQALLAARSNEQRAATAAAAPLAELLGRTGEVVRSGWPTPAAGPLVGWRLAIGSQGGPVVTTYHLGPPLGGSAELLLARSMSAQLGAILRLVDAPLPREPLTALAGADRVWLADAVQVIDRAAGLDSLVGCVQGRLNPPRRTATVDRAVLAALRQTPLAKAGRMDIRDGGAWSIRVATGSCDPRTPAPPTAGGADGRGGGVGGAVGAPGGARASPPRATPPPARNP